MGHSEDVTRFDPTERPTDVTRTSLGEEKSPELTTTFGQASDVPAVGGLPSVPGYEVLGELGRGGIGVVYLARQVALNRTVALKLIGGTASTSTLIRFRQEAEAVAKLQHSNIVQIFEVGSCPAGSFLALEYVDGGTVKDKVAGVPQPPRDAARLVETLARAIQHAHDCRLIHRDLKPHNVLLTAGGVPKITDFGLARSLDAGVGVTMTSDFVGTPAYSSPEQVDGRFGAVGAGTDVHGLGVILYELLVGRVPFDGTTIPEVLRSVVEREPVAVRRLRPEVPRDLETICMKCLRKEPGKRYTSAEALADDLHRFQAGEPVAARPVGRVERAGRWAKRNPAVAGLLTTIFLLLTAAAVGGAVFSYRLSGALRDAKNDRDRAVNAEQEGKRKLFDSYLSDANATRASSSPGRRFVALEKVHEALALGSEIDLTAADRQRLRNTAASALCMPDLSPGPVWNADAEPPAGVDPAIVTAARARTAVLRLPEKRHLLRGRRWYSPDGRFVACSTVEFIQRSSVPVEVWRIDGPTPVRVFTVAGEVIEEGAAFSPDGEKVAFGLADDTVQVYESASGRALAKLPNAARTVTWGTASRRLAVVGGDRVRVWDCAASPPRIETELSHDGVLDADWHPSGRQLASIGNDTQVRVWELPLGRAVNSWPAVHKGGSLVSFSPTGDRILTNEWTSILRVWDPTTGRQLVTYPKGSGLLNVCTATIGPFTLHDDQYRTLRFAGGQELQAIARPPLLGTSVDLRTALHPNGRLLLMQSQDGLAVIDLFTRQQVAGAAMPMHLTGMRFDDTSALWVSGRQGLMRWPTATEPNGTSYRIGPPERIGDTFGSDGFAISDDGRVAAAERGTAGASIFHPGPPARLRVVGPQYDVRHVTLSADGRLLATRSYFDDTARTRFKVWDTTTGRLIAILPRPDAEGMQGFSVDGRWVYTERYVEPRMRRYDLTRVGTDQVPTWEPVERLPQHLLTRGGGGLYVENPDPGVLLLRAAADGREIVRLPFPDPAGLNEWRFTADGGRLIAVGREKQNREAYVYDLRRIRRGLVELGLDWDQPAYPPEPDPNAAEAVNVAFIDANTARSLAGLLSAELRRANRDVLANPLNADAHYRLGAMLMPTQQYATAYRHLSIALTLAPGTTAALSPQAQAAFSLRRWADAITAADRWLAESPNDYNLLTLRAASLRSLGRPADAAADYTRLIEQYPNDSEYYNLRGRCYLAVGERAKAAADWRRAIELGANNPSFLNEVAWHLLTDPPPLRDPKRAMALIRQAMAKEPANLNNLNTLGVAQYRNGLYREGIVTLEKCLATGDGVYDAYDLYFMAMCHAKCNDPAKARNCFDRAVRWVDEGKKLTPEQLAELKEFRAEATAVLQAAGATLPVAPPPREK